MAISQTRSKGKSKLRVAQKLAGKKIKCPNCAAVFPFSTPAGTSVADSC